MGFTDCNFWLLVNMVATKQMQIYTDSNKFILIQC